MSIRIALNKLSSSFRKTHFEANGPLNLDNVRKACLIKLNTILN